MKAQRVFIASLIVLSLPTTIAIAEPEDFETLCRTVSAEDGLPQTQIDLFCPCLAERVSDSSELEAELRASVTKEGDPESRLAGLSEAASDAVKACQGS